jgi:signal transduction histidine kinase
VQDFDQRHVAHDSGYKILVVEDNPADLELLQRELRRGSVECVLRCVETEEDLRRELREFNPDVVLSDFALPRFSGMGALAVCRELAPHLPFVFVSGTMGEQAAVEALKQGATDYLLKGHTTRLCPAVTRAVEEARRRQEHARLGRQLAQAQKMEAIGQLAGGVAHDFNNLLTVITGFSDMALSRPGVSGELEGDLREIRGAAQRAAELTRQLLAFSRRQIIAPRVLVLNGIVQGAEKLLRRLIGEDVELRTVLDPALGHVKADPGQVEQVIVNLAVNARDAMPNGGKLTIETANVELDEAYGKLHASVIPGPHVLLAVSDTGCGMDAAVIAHLFEPFFTTKAPGKGTGLGLATVYGIVKQSGGHVWVYSEPGRGSTFKVYLPRVDLAPDNPPSPEPRARGGSEVVLVVEDDESVRRLACAVLERNGYTTLQASDGVAALEVSARNPRIDLVITDVVMPQMGGPEVAEKLRQQRPHLKVLFFSGYTSNAIVHHGILDRGLSFLQKPFTPESLARTVRAVLDGRDEGRAAP